MRHAFYFLIFTVLTFLVGCGSKQYVFTSKRSPLPVAVSSIYNTDKYIHTDSCDYNDSIDTAEIDSVASFDTLHYIDYTDKLKRGKAKYRSEREIDIIVVHSSHSLGADTFNVDGVINLYNRYGVGAHYLIARDGVIYKLADENDITFHAGESTLPGEPSRHSLNKSSIGIEIINTPLTGPTDAQYIALATLTEDIQTRHNIKYIYGHSDIAPLRKTDPWAFDWEKYFNLISFTNPTKSDTTSASASVLPFDSITCK